jgi:hypothetical protein
MSVMRVSIRGTSTGPAAAAISANPKQRKSRQELEAQATGRCASASANRLHQQEAMGEPGRVRPGQDRRRSAMRGSSDHHRQYWSRRSSA